MRQKYGNHKIIYNGEMFDSQKEANRWAELRLLERVGKIALLTRQVKFVLIPVQKDSNGKTIEREVSYIADFVYYDLDGGKVVEDTKGFKTKDYIIKRKLMLWVHGIRIKEV